MDYRNEKIHEIALTLVKGLGPRLFRLLMNEYGKASIIHDLSEEELSIHTKKAEIRNAILQRSHIERAEQEMRFCEKQGIEILSFNDKNYPQRLNFYDNTPGILYYKGNADLNSRKIVSIVGTRDPSNHGKIFCENIVRDLVKHNCLVLSGLAYGIDVTAHKASVKAKLATVGVVAHGHDKLYPESNRPLANKMISNGGLLSEFVSETEMLRELFPMRNRIVAAMSDAVIVVESTEKGGSLITANFANQYNKPVFAIPGRPQDDRSKGCNMLIKQHKAHMYESIEDLEEILRWNSVQKATQGSLFVEMSDDEKTIINHLRQFPESHVDELMKETNLSIGVLSSNLLNLELKSCIKSLPGKRYICI